MGEAVARVRGGAAYQALHEGRPLGHAHCVQSGAHECEAMGKAFRARRDGE